MSNAKTIAPEAPVQEAPVQGTPEQKPATSPVGSFFKVEEEDDNKVLKWRFIAKGTSLASILAVFGAVPVEGDKQVSFKVPEAGDLELGDVVRHVFAKAHAAGVTLADLVGLIAAKSAKS